jgi:hypothetical protein
MITEAIGFRVPSAGRGDPRHQGDRGQSAVMCMRRTPPVKVERKGAGYASKAGDARRSGRADDLRAAVRGMASIEIAFLDRGSMIEARLGVIVVGRVTHDPAAGGYFWAIDLPGIPPAPRPAGDPDKAKGAIRHKVIEWCEAAKLISTSRLKS